MTATREARAAAAGEETGAGAGVRGSEAGFGVFTVLAVCGVPEASA